MTAKPCWILFALLVAGCTSFDQSDEGDSKKILLGKTFTIALPAIDEVRRPRIANEGLVRFVGIQRDPSNGIDTFNFKAIGMGETEIFIPKSSAASGAPEYVFPVNVVIGGSPPY
jgi:hypothetical protein